MIEKLEVAGFKRFSEDKFALKPLTVLTGLNGSGKTSLIHSILLIHESIHGIGDNVVRLNGPFGLELGTAGDVVNWEASDRITLTLHEQAAEFKWEFGWDADEAMYLIAKNSPSGNPSALMRKTNCFAYLSAERYGPRGSLKASPLPVDKLEVGAKGEYCAQVLETLGSKPALSTRHHPESKSTGPSLLKYEVEKWLSECARPVEIDSIRSSGSTQYALNFRVPGGIWVRATNMGFGVSYALPIILAGLTLEEGGLMIVENPEAHLHPAGQSRIGFFLAWLASRGVQVIVETHSDHVLNGIRRAIGEYKELPNTDAIVHFFSANEDTPALELAFTPIGGVSHWPQGFFDQYQIDTAALGRIRRNGVIREGSPADGIRD